MARRLPSLNAVRAFEAAARHSSFTAAADELCVTHAAVSRHIRDLEKWLGRELFVRTRRGVTLTEAGQRYGAEVTPLFDALAGATQALLRPHSKRLVVSVEPAMASRWLVPRLGQFSELHPDIEMQVDPDARLADFRSGEADTGLRYGGGAWSDVEAVRLSESLNFPVCSPRLIDGIHGLSPKDLASFPLLHEQHKQHWRNWLARAGVELSADARGATFQAHLAIEAAEAGQGFALGDQILCTEALLSGRLVRPFSIDVEDAGQYYLVRAKGSRESETARSFRLWLQEEIEVTRRDFDAFRRREK
ncbi:MAG: transcriptional regulator GcvA [Parvibaculaceae bacterium]